MATIKIAVVESPNPIDLFEGRTESEGLVASCKLIGHQSVSFFAKSSREFKEICLYLSSADTDQASKNPSAPLFLHLSCHGNENGIAFGSNHMNWKELVQAIHPILNNPFYNGNFALVVSACGSGDHDLHRHITNAHKDNDSLRVPQYIFSIPGCSVCWDDALVGWILFYHKVSRIKLDNRGKVQSTLKKIYKGTELRFSYHRWDHDENKYKIFTPKD